MSAHKNGEDARQGDAPDSVPPSSGEARLRAALAGVPGWVIMLDRKLRIIDVNRFLPGLPPDHILGKSYLDFVRPELRERVGGVLRGVLASGEAASYESRSMDAYGGRMFEVTVSPLCEGQIIVGLTVVALDNTRLKETEARLLRSDQLANLGTLVAGVAHEVNNPLTYVLGNLELLQLQPYTETERRVGEALEGAQRIRGAVSDLMSLLRARESPLGDHVALHEVVERALRVARREITLRARLEQDVDPTLTVVGSADRVGQVLLNLLLNAAHATEEGRPDQNVIAIRTHAVADGFVRVSVSDTGRGIERSLIGRIFDPFVTTKAPGEGTGLGLYVCHSIVQALGGRIWVESELGQGTTFHVDLPGGQPASAAQRAVELRLSVPETLQLELLVVEDEPSVREFMREVLGRDAAAGTSSVGEARQVLAVRNFDVVIADLSLPDGSGLDVLDAAREQPDAPAFLFTTGGPLGERARARLAASGAPLLAKPFTAAALLEAVRSVAEPTS